MFCNTKIILTPEHRTEQKTKQKNPRTRTELEHKNFTVFSNFRRLNQIAVDEKLIFEQALANQNKLWYLQMISEFEITILKCSDCI